MMLFASSLIVLVSLVVNTALAIPIDTPSRSNQTFTPVPNVKPTLADLSERDAANPLRERQTSTIFYTCTAANCQNCYAQYITTITLDTCYKIPTSSSVFYQTGLTAGVDEAVIATDDECQGECVRSYVTASSVQGVTRLSI